MGISEHFEASPVATDWMIPERLRKALKLLSAASVGTYIMLERDFLKKYNKLSLVPSFAPRATNNSAAF